MKAKMRKITSFLLVLVMIASLCPLTVLAAEGESAVPEPGPAAEESAPPAELPAAESPAPEAEEEPAADGEAALVLGPVYEPVALPVALDGTGSVTVNYYDNAGSLLGSETVSAGAAPDAAVGPYVTVGEEQELILGFWTAPEMSLAALPADGVLIMPMFRALTANQDYYAVYAPKAQNAAYIAYYLSLGDGAFSPIHWGSVAVEGEGSKPAADTVPDYMAFQVTDSESNVYELYLSIAWYADAAMSGTALSPADVAISSNTVYYGEINQSFYAVSFRDAEGDLLALFPIEEGKTVGAYPGATAMPAGDYWQDGNGNIYTAAEIQALPITANMTLTAFAGYTVSYYFAGTDQLIDSETVLPGGKPAEVPVAHANGVDDRYKAYDYTFDYRWYTNKEADGEPVDVKAQTIQQDTAFYAGQERNTIVFCYESGDMITFQDKLYGARVDWTPTITIEGYAYHVPGWTDRDGNPVDPYALSVVEDVHLYAIEDGIKVHYYYGDQIYENELVLSGDHPQYVPTFFIKTIFNPSGTGALLDTVNVPIVGWEDENGEAVDPATAIITEETSFYGVEGHTVTYMDADGTTVLGTETVADGAAPTQAPGKNSSDKAITNWLNASGGFVVLESLKITADTTLTAWYSPGLVTDEHGAYISGYGNGIFSPNSDLSRAEAAKIIYSLVDNPAAGPFSASFSDMSSHWANEAVSFLASHKIITGYTNGTFLPNLGITRAEFVTILCRLFPMEAGSCNFTDVPEGIWYYNAVASAVEKGWVNGYLESDGTYTFRPNNVITRAEAVTIMNRVLGRAADRAAFDATERMIYRDVAPSHWAFYQVMEASIAHDFTAAGTGESWGDFTLPTTGIREGLRNPDNVNLYYVDEDGLILRLDAGLNTLPNGNTYYAPKDGCFIPLYDRGIYDLGGKLYYIQRSGAVLTDRFMDGYITPVYEYDGKMYYIKEDFSLARSEYVGKLYFGADGAYTSGDAELDALIYEFCKNVILDANQTQEEKLRSMYNYVRDCGRFSYFNHRFTASATDWSLIGCAKRMLQTNKGECFHWASMMVQIMRRLGFDAYKQNGDVISSTGARAPHAWEIINWPNGKQYMFDVQLEWGWYYGHYAYGRTFNLFKMSYKGAQSIGTYEW